MERSVALTWLTGQGYECLGPVRLHDGELRRWDLLMPIKGERERQVIIKVAGCRQILSIGGSVRFGYRTFFKDMSPLILWRLTPPAPPGWWANGNCPDCVKPYLPSDWL